MKKIGFFIFAFVLFSILANAQGSTNFELAKKIKQSGGDTKMIDVFVKGDVTKIKRLIASDGGIFKYASGNISVIKVSTKTIGKLLSDKSIQRIESYVPHFQPLQHTDTLLINNNVLPVHNGTAPLTQAYDGTGIVIGFVDTGIDFAHPDFKDSNGKSRIKYLWDQKLTTNINPPQPFNYGEEWTNTDIDNGLANAHEDVTYGGHGTGVAGIAVGNGLANGLYKGIAPKADIIFVAYDFNSVSPTVMTDAVEYIFAKADSLGEPCVINASLGDYFGSHDGKDLQAQFISNKINEKNGRSLVAAAGNAGHNPIHLGYTVTSDTNFTFFYSAGTSTYFQMWADTNDFKNIDFAIGADQMSPTHSFRGRTNFYHIANQVGVYQEDTIYNNGNRIAIVQSYGDTISGTYSMEFNIVSDSAGYYYRLITTGSGKFDAWSYNLSSDTLPSVATLPDSIYYKSSDINQTIVSSFQCLDNVITVGDYGSQKSFIRYDGLSYIDSAIVEGELSYTSSWGPTRDGRIKPDISAPGNMTISASPLAMTAIYASTQPEWYDSLGYHVRGGGTSNACPSVAGVAALYLQQNPNATAMQIKNAIITCPTTDQYTGTSLPNNQWGYGKANAFNALTQCMTLGVTNFYSKQSSLLIYPNPSASKSTINIEIENFLPTDKIELNIYNTMGELIKSIRVNRKNYELNNSFASGVYYCNLMINDKKISTQKLIVLQ